MKKSEKKNRTSKTPPYRYWKILAPAGLALIGMGFSLASEATLWKGQEVETWKWVGLGTIGLVVLNAGVSIFGDAVKRRFWDEYLRREAEKG